MCGIAGFAGADRARIERMTRALAHRGPDGNAVWVGADASLGHARLAILDPRPEGDQPMWNAEKTLGIVYNGEIFNYRRLREQEGFACRTGTDTEVMLLLYERYGMQFVERLIGMFAFAIVDTRTRAWHLARDPSGIKPLFVAYPGGKLHFASEMRALLSAMPAKPNLHIPSLSRFLELQYVPGPATMCEGIESLPPGTALTWHEDGKEERRIIPAKVERPTFRSRAECAAHVPEILDACVKDHLVSDKPVGVFLSGGMDSSTALHHMCGHAEKPVRTYTARFEATEEEGAKRFNTDADLAALTAKHYGTEHHEVLLTAALCRDLYKATATALDQPNADSVATAQVLLATEAKRSVDVVLAGAGGDELFGGYPRYRVARILSAFRMLPAGLRRAAGGMFGYPGDVLSMQPGPALARRLLARPRSEIDMIVRGDWFDPAATETYVAERYAAAVADSPVRRFMEFDRITWLVDESLRLADATTMARGLECRVPFLDPRMIAASLATPAEWHVGLRRTKALLKDAYRGILPEHLFMLPKASFYPPLAKWMRREVGPLVEEAIEHPRIAEYFNVEVLRTLFELHRTHERYALHPLSNVLQLACWFDGVYDAAR